MQQHLLLACVTHLCKFSLSPQLCRSFLWRSRRLQHSSPSHDSFQSVGIKLRPVGEGVLLSRAPLTWLFPWMHLLFTIQWTSFVWIRHLRVTTFIELCAPLMHKALPFISFALSVPCCHLFHWCLISSSHGWPIPVGCLLWSFSAGHGQCLYNSSQMMVPISVWHHVAFIHVFFCYDLWLCLLLHDILRWCVCMLLFPFNSTSDRFGCGSGLILVPPIDCHDFMGTILAIEKHYVPMTISPLWHLLPAGALDSGLSLGETFLSAIPLPSSKTCPPHFVLLFRAPDWGAPHTLPYVGDQLLSSRASSAIWAERMGSRGCLIVCWEQY